MGATTAGHRASLQTSSAGNSRVLRFAPLSAHELAAGCGLGLLSVLWFEGIKWARLRASKPLEPGGPSVVEPARGVA